MSSQAPPLCHPEPYVADAPKGEHREGSAFPPGSKSSFLVPRVKETSGALSLKSAPPIDRSTVPPFHRSSACKFRPCSSQSPSHSRSSAPSHTKSTTRRRHAHAWGCAPSFRFEI